MCTQCLQPLKKMLLLPTPVWQTVYGNLPELLRRSRPTTDHDLHLPCIHSQSFLLHCFVPSQEPPDTFLKWFSDDNKVIGIEVLRGDPRSELWWQGFKHNDEEYWAEYRVLVNTDNSLQSLHCTSHMQTLKLHMTHSHILCSQTLTLVLLNKLRCHTHF